MNYDFCELYCNNIMKGRMLSNLCTCFIPNKNLRHKIRNWKCFETEYDSLKKDLTFIKDILKYSTLLETLPQAQGLSRSLQLLCLEKLTVFAQLCDEASIDYWLDYGTLLGTCRHHGFIPWDDDIDVGIQYEDREKVLNMLEKHGMDVDKYGGEEGEIRIVVLSSAQYSVHIDIFSYKKMNGLVDEDISVIEQFMRNLNDRYVLFCSAYHHEAMQYLASYRSVKGGSMTVYVRGIDYIPAIRRAAKVVRYSDLFPLKKGIFEGKEFHVPQGSMDYLNDIYGDCMAWPSHLENNRIAMKLSTGDQRMLMRKGMPETEPFSNLLNNNTSR